VAVDTQSKPLPILDWKRETDAEATPRPLLLQTFGLAPALRVDHLVRLSSETGGLATSNQLLIAVLQATGHRDLAQAAEDLERFLSLPAEQTGVGEPWEERNIRIPVELRK
jgi:hypothetical protein